MKQKIRKLLFELTRNSRISTKNLSKILKTSQQSCSYLINSLKKKKIIKESTAVIDAVKLGFTNIIVGFNYLDFDNKITKDIVEYLKNNPMIIAIEECKQGVDLLVEFSCQNLSAFNKNFSEIIDKFSKFIKICFILPVIVKHKFPRNYLARKRDETDMILCGDRELFSLSKNEANVLNELIKKPDITLVAIAKNTKISVKSISIIKKRLEKKKIIMGYGCIFNNKRLNINKFFLFLSFFNLGTSEMNKLVEFARQNKNMINLTKIIGEFQIMLVVEEFTETDIIKEIRSNFSVKNYFVVESKNIVKKMYCPLIEEN